MKTSELEYFLPPEQIAQASVRPRDASKLLVVDAASKKTQHMVFRDIETLLRRGDVLVFNNTKVFRARLRGKTKNGGDVEILLVRPVADGGFECLGKPAKRLRVGDEIIFSDVVHGSVRVRRENGEFVMDFFRAHRGVHGSEQVKNSKSMSQSAVIRFANVHGEIPLPPYVANGPEKLSQYQTVYARHVGSVAAPTAGFHFTRSLRARLLKKGVQFAEVTLHVGIGTFQTIKTDEIDEHKMHSELVDISLRDAKKIAAAHSARRRVIAVGTTTTRALEGASDAVLSGRAWTGDVHMFIRPGYKFQVISGLITNFHLPKSTLLLLVGALIQEKTGADGIPHLKKLYSEAIARNYRFFSFGDAMLIS